MGTTLTGTTPQDTYDSLIKVTDNGPLSGTAKYLSDGLGNDSVLALSTGNVGIGTTTAPEKLSVAGAIITTGGITGHGANRVSISQEGANGAFLQSYGANTSTVGAFTFRQASSDFSVTQIPLAITSTGNVGIGTSAPAVKLHVKGTAETGSVLRLEPTTSTTIYSQVVGVNGDIQIQADPLNNEGSSAVKMFVDGSEIIRVTTDGLAFGPFAAANALDDYEEGTWTPTTSTSGYTISASSGTYTKIGRQVVLQYSVTFSAVDGSSNSVAVIGSVPFAASATFVGQGRDTTTSGAAYAAVISTSNLTISSIDGVATGSSRIFATSEAYVFTLTYFV